MLARAASSPDVFAQKFDPIREMALLVALDAGTYRAASFLDDRILGPSAKGAWVGLDRLIEVSRGVQNVRPLHFIFHSGHVGSTLVSRLLDEAGPVLPLREPLALRLLADAHDAIAKPDALIGAEAFDRLLDAFLRLWSRGYTDTSCVILKATSSTTRLAPAILARRPAARAICLSLKAEPYLATLLAGQFSPGDLRGHGPERYRRLAAAGMVPPLPFHRMSLGEIAAMSWLAETMSQIAAMGAGAERVLAVDFDRFLADVGGEIARIARHLGVPHAPDFGARAAQSITLTRYAKAPEHDYTPQLRAQILADSHVRNRDEIQKGLAWLSQMGRTHHGVANVLNRT